MQSDEELLALHDAEQTDSSKPDLARLTAKFRKLHELREVSDRAKDLAATASREYRRAEAELCEEMTAAQLTSLKVEDLATFVVGQRSYVKVTDLFGVMHWAQEAGLLENVQYDGDTVTIPFRVVEDVDEETGRTSQALLNGILKAKPYAKPINDHVRQKLDEDDTLLDGVELSFTPYITIRRAR